MSIFKMKSIGVYIFALVLALSAVVAATGQNAVVREPQLPPGCENLAVGANEYLAFKVYAQGVQVYKWDGSAWVLVGPIADLYLSQRIRLKVGSHYAGPTWEGLAGSLVRGANPVRCQPDPNSIPWLRLDAALSSRNGLFGEIKHIQRINTSGGQAPVRSGSTVGEEVQVPYSTEYYFYKEIQANH